MRHVMLMAVAAGLTAAADSVTVPAKGPRCNPDDQVRFFWNIQEDVYPPARDAGFNTFFTFFWSGWYFNYPEVKKRHADARRKFLAQMEADQVDCVDRLNVDAFGPKEKFLEYVQVNRDGSKNPRSLDYNKPETQALARQMAKDMADEVKDCPALVGVHVASEVRDGSKPSWSKEYQANCRAALGFDMPPNAGLQAPHYGRIEGFPVSRVIGLDYPLLRYCVWHWKDGDGWNRFDDEVAANYRSRFSRPLFSSYDPAVRTPPLWGSGGHVSYINQWVYTYPQPFAISYVVSEERAMARGCAGQKVLAMLQGIAYRNRVAPKDRTVENPPDWLAEKPNAIHITAPPDMMREGLWALAARQLDGLGIYAYNAIFEIPGVDPKAASYQMTNPETFETIKDVFAKVFVPLGPLLKAVPERKPEVVIVESYAHCFFAGRTSFGWGYRWGDLATTAHLQPETVFEEEIARDGIPPSVKVLLMPDCEVLTEPTYKAVEAFQARGGIIAADEDLVPGLMPDVALPTCLMTQYHRSFDSVKDTLGLRQGAKELRERLDWAYLPPSDSDNPDIFTHVRSFGDADYLFAFNDRRGYGDYIGQWKLMAEKGLPSQGTLTLRRAAGAVYDLVAHRPAKFAVRDGVTEIPVAYETTDGSVFLVTSRPLGALSVRVDGTAVTVETKDADVMIPIEITAEGLKKPFYAAVSGGKWRHEFSGIRGPVKVRNLADGQAFGSAR